MHHQEETMSEAVLAAVADREGVEVCDIQQPLFDAIDPEALDELFRNGQGEVTFEYLDYIVSIDSSKNLIISSKDETSRAGGDRWRSPRGGQ